jgi:hypothetical protein
VIDDPDDPGMLEAGEKARLDLESLIVVGVGRLLERNLAAGLVVNCPIDGSHRTGRDRLDHVVAVVHRQAQYL